MKSYSNNAANSTLDSVFGNLDKEKRNKKFYKDLQMMIKALSDEDKGYFISTFNEIVRITTKQFSCIPLCARKYYSEFFRNKIITLYNKKIKKISNMEFKCYCNNLLNAYIKSNITKAYLPIEPSFISKIYETEIIMASTPPIKKNVEITLTNDRNIDCPEMTLTGGINLLEPEIKPEQIIITEGKPIKPIKKTTKNNNIQSTEW